MHETPEELEELQALIDRSMDGMAEHMARIFTPGLRLSARQVVAYVSGTTQLAVATVTEKGEPRVSPVDAFFYRGRFWFGTSPRSRRAVHLRARPAVSATYFVGDELAIVVHGTAAIVERDDAGAKEVDEAATAVFGWSPFAAGPGAIMIRIDPTSMYTRAARPDDYPEG